MAMRCDDFGGMRYAILMWDGMEYVATQGMPTYRTRKGATKKIKELNGCEIKRYCRGCDDVLEIGDDFLYSICTY